MFFPRREVKHLLPATVLKLRSVRPQEWTAMIQEELRSSIHSMTVKEAKIKFLGRRLTPFVASRHLLHLELVQAWPLFGVTFFPVQVRIGFCFRREILTHACHLSSQSMFLPFHRRV